MAKRVLIVGYYGFGNAGDEAILGCMVRDLRAEVPDLAITVISGNPLATRIAFGVHAILLTEYPKIVEIARTVDLIILGGGGLFQDYFESDPDTLLTRDYLGLAWYSTFPFLATLLDKPLMIYAVGVGPLFSEVAKAYTLASFEQASAITVRDDASRAQLIALGLPAERIETTADPVLGLTPPKKADALDRIRAEFVPPPGKPIIGVSLRNWAVDHQAGGRWITETAKALDHAVEALDAIALYIPFQMEDLEAKQVAYRLNDLALVGTLAAHMQHPERLVTLRGAYSPLEIAGIVSCCDLMLGMRLHALIMAANADVPAVGLAYDPKVRLFMTGLGMEAFTLDLDHVTESGLSDLLTTAYHERDGLSQQLRTKVAELSERGRRNPQIAATVLTKDHTPSPDLPPTTLRLLKRATLTLSLRADESRLLNGTYPALVAEKDEAITRFLAQIGDAEAQLRDARAALERLHQQYNATQADLDAAKIAAHGYQLEARGLVVHLVQTMERDQQALNTLSLERDQLRESVDDLTVSLEQTADQVRLSQKQRGILYQQYLTLEAQLRAAQQEYRETTDTLQRVLKTRVWRLATRYWIMRERLKRWLGIPFRFCYRTLRRMYHILVPLPLRLGFRGLRWRVRGRQKPASLTLNNSPITVRDTANARLRNPITPTTRRNQPSVFIFGTVPHYDIGGGQRSAQLANTFNKMGYNVYYFYANVATDGSDEQMAALPTILHAHMSAISPRQLIPYLGSAPLFIFEAPDVGFEAYLELAQKVGARIVYEQIDDWESELGDNFFSRSTLQRFIGESTLIIATSRTLADYIRGSARSPELRARLDRLIYAPNAVDADLFDPIYARPCPADLVMGRPTLLYYGSLWGTWFNWELLAAVATALPDAAINLVGDYASIPPGTMRMPPNVHFLGLKRQKELPAYLEHSTIAIIPFRQDDFSASISPLKVFEYIAMQKPVLANPLPDIVGYPGVFTSTDPADWVAFATGGYKTAWTPAQRERDQAAFRMRNNWYARCNEMLAELEARAHTPTISIILLNHNNKSVIFKCIDSLFEFKGHYDYDLIVVDNLSTDGSYELLQQDERIDLYRNDANNCSTGRNLGVRQAKGDFIVFLDSDQWVVSENWLNVALDILDKQRHIGAVARNAGWFEPGRVTGLITLDFPSEGIAPDQLFRTDIAYLATAGWVMRRALFNTLEGFDPAYDPVLFEDTDLSLQIRDAGFEIAYTSHLAINHLPHQSTRSSSDQHSPLMARNGAYFKQKWMVRNPALLEYYVSSG